MSRFFQITVLVFLVLLLTSSLGLPQDTPSDKESMTLQGTLFPRASTEFTLELLAYKGELKIEQVTGHGHEVAAGETLIAFNTDAITELIEETSWALDAAVRKRNHALLDVQVFQENHSADIELKKQKLDDASIALKRYQETGGPIALTNSEQSVMRAQDSLDYTNEELEQLIKMYKESDLAVDTQEIVLNRTKRKLRYAKTRLEHAKIRHHLFTTMDHPLKLRNLNQSVEKAQRDLQQAMEKGELTRLDKVSAVDSAKRAAAKQETKLSDLKADMNTIRKIQSDKGGIFIHGSLLKKMQGKGTSGMGSLFAGLAVGDTVKAGAILFTVYDPSQFDVITSIPEKSISNHALGQRVTCTFGAIPGVSFQGKVSKISYLPVASGKNNVFWASAFIETKHENLRPGMKATITFSEK